ncbi:metallophosphoesterase family protein [Natronospora cellulosivora (SeqCode)]
MTNEKILLHISDTPDCIYPFIFKLIDRLEPNYIIHTGDLVDNVKIGVGAPLRFYERGLKKLIEGFEKRKKIKKYIIAGNHDSLELLSKINKSADIISEGSILRIEDINFGLAHHMERLSNQAPVNLYGHNNKILENIEFEDNDRIFLNGLLNINIILLPSLEIHQISYPLQTDSARKYKNLKLP